MQFSARSRERQGRLSTHQDCMSPTHRPKTPNQLKYHELVRPERGPEREDKRMGEVAAGPLISIRQSVL